MKRFFKLAVALLTLVFTVVLVGFVYVLNLDPNDHKDYIYTKFAESTGLELEINGDIGLTLYPWLGVTVADVVIHNAPGFSTTPILEARQAALRVKLLPMLDREYEIDTIRLLGARIHLETNAAGNSNWNSAIAPSAESGTEADSQPLLNNLVIGGVDIQDAALTFDDRFNDVRYTLDNLTFATGELVYGEPVDLSLAFDAGASRPALSAGVNLTGTVLYDLDNERYDLNPLTMTGSLAGASVPGGSTTFSLGTSVSVDMAQDLLTLRDFSLSALDAQVNATINGQGVFGDKPQYQLNLAAAGNDLSLLFRVLENDALVAQIAGLGSQAFRVSGLVESSPKQGTLKITGLDASLLDALISGDVSAQNLQSGSPVIRGTIKASGPDLPTLLEVAGQLQGGQNSELARYGRELQQAPDQDFLLNTDFDANLATGYIQVPVFEARLLGASMSGNVNARDINTDAPVFQGRLNASGPDLPILMRIAGQLSGGRDSALNRYGRQLRNVNGKNFTLNSPFNIDMASGNIDIDTMEASTLGLRLNGNLAARNFQAANGTMKGQFTLTGRNLSGVLRAIEQPDLAEVLQSLAMNVSVDGTRQNLTVSPLNLDLILSGPRIPNSPVTLALNADSVVNLEAESLVTRNFSLAGLGLNLSGSLNAKDFSTRPAYSGQLTVPAFNLRRLLQQLNQEVPVTRDNTILQSLALSADFAGSDTDLRLSRIDMMLDESHITGDFTLAGFDNPATNFTLALNTINLDRYSAPATDTPAENTELPVDSLRTLNMKGNISIGQVTSNNLKMTDFVLAINASDGDLSLSPISANLYEGRFEGNIRLNSAGAVPAASINSTLTSINLSPLLRDFMGATYVTGKGNIQLALAGSGADTNTIKRNLNGTGSLKLEDGELRGVDVGSVLRQLETMIRDKQVRAVTRGETTPFETFTATINISNGIISSDDLLIDSSGFTITGMGTLANLANDSIAFNLVTAVDKTPASDEQAYDIGGYSLPIACTGSLASPTCLPDIQAILAGAITTAVQRGLTSLLERAVGVPQQNEDQPTQDTQQQQDPQQEEEKDPREELINKALDSLFKR